MEGKILKRKHTTTILMLGLLMLSVAVLVYYQSRETPSDIRIVISPYQDLAMLVNLHHLELESAYETTVKIKTIPWEETYTTLLSAGKPADMGFASFADFLTKRENLNKNSDDPLLFVFPAYIFKGGAFVSFDDSATVIDRNDLENRDKLKQFLDMRLGFPKATLYQMIIYYIAEKAGLAPADVEFMDVGFDAGLLGARKGDLDAAAVGLTQLTEAMKDGGIVVLDMDTLGFADITGFIVLKSVLEAKRKHIENVIRMWFDCVDYVMSDIDQNSETSLNYLAENAATEYTLENYKLALAQEYFPRTLGEVNREIISRDGTYSAEMINEIIGQFLTNQEVISASPGPPKFIKME